MRAILFSALLVGASPVSAQIAGQWSVPQEALEREAAKDRAGALARVEEELAKCDAAATAPYECTLLLIVGSRFANEAGKGQRSLDLAETALTRIQASSERDPQLIAALTYAMGNAFAALGRAKEAEEFLTMALEYHRMMLPQGHPVLATIMNNLAMAKIQQGRPSEAIPLLEEAIALREAALGPQSVPVGVSLDNLAIALNEMGRFQEADPYYRRALDIFLAQLPASDPYIATAMLNLASNLRERGRLDEALTLAERGLAIRRTALAQDDPELGSAWHTLAAIQADLGLNAAAQESYREAIAIRRKALIPIHPDIATSTQNLALLLDRGGDLAGGEIHHRQALEIYEAGLPATRLMVGVAAVNLGLNLFGQGRSGEAEPLLRRGRAMLADSEIARPRILAGESLATLLSLRPGGSREARQLLRSAAGEVLARIDAFAEFDGEASAELRDYASVFRGQVRSAWVLAAGG